MGIESHIQLCLSMDMKIILLAFFFTSIALGALVPDEVQALRDIAKTLGKQNWNFTVDPCSGLRGWTVRCDCSLNSTACHVTGIVIREESLQGTLPPELVRLPYLQDISLTRNFLSGTIPPEWGSMKLVTIFLLTNRLTGSIPIELANISTLKILNIGFNQLSGNLPELGKLPRIERLHLSSNNFTGEIPATFAGLTKLTHFRISDNQFSGKIPDFIGNWTNLRLLAIVGSGLSGPIPVGLSLLVNLVNLRISNLNGPDSDFPQLNNMTQMTTMILRSCNIVGSLPDFIDKMPSLNVVDLSFNKLSGDIPSSFTGLSKVEFLYLSGNMLSGQVPDWLMKGGNNVDLSYNNFSIRNLKPSACEEQNVNLFASSLEGNNSKIIPCSRSCPKMYYSFHINCGGKEVYVNGGKKYDEDVTEGRAAQLFLSERSNWAFSNTGNFIDDDQRASKSYIVQNISGLFMADSELYTSARLSPLSLTYYGFCLESGNYTVNLHFAEIMFTDDKNFSSLGRRVFDVYIQGKLVQKDFNIAAEAGGSGKAVIKNYTVVVNNNDLEIRLYWAGKGTTSVPERGIYGPLISAIAVDADFTIPLASGSLPLGAVIAIVVVGAILIVLLLGILWWINCSQKKSTLDQELKGLEMQTGFFTLRQIMAATNNFDITNKIGEGGFGPVYKGFLSDGTIIAVKQLSSKSHQGNREFINEIGMISALQNPHLVKLYGCCVEGSQLLLVYEYMENNSLARALFGPENFQLHLDWPARKNICIGIAKGLAFLHEESRLKIIHRDIKATNVLLDKNLNPKISDFGLAKLHEEDNTHISTRIAGTRGYMAPEYAMHGYLTKKADVYSFGIVVLEIISGRTNTTQQSEEEFFYLRDWAHLLKDGGNLMELVDPRLDMDFNTEEIMVMIDVALLCTENSPTLRPTMSKVVSVLEGRPDVQEVVSDESEIMDEMKLESMRNSLLKKEETGKDETQATNLSSHASQTTSTSLSDLYPVDPDSYFWEKTH